uniref:B3 domain-containing transcription factor VRN1-like n=1 Tax=Fragaria vesca subsp. vesca TaxID=101020 RepID=UPI0005CA83FE|nr:PREDICTED: B3 domain-containing transcription factor VRN1-like [Fragaria vesca subsp. vesca]
MASSYVRRKCADHRPSSSATTPRRFLEVILDDTSRERKLRIPKSFLDIYGEDLSNWVYFKLPYGPELDIGLTSFNGEVWFRKGWPEFSKLYSLEKGYSLIFGYEGNSRFQVSIFDGSNNMEIDYTTRRMLGSEESDQDDDISLDISEDIRPNVDSEERVKKETHWSKSEMLRKNQFVAERHGGGKARLFQRAKSYNCSFKVPMHSTYINHNLLWLPKAFVKTYLVKQPTDAALKISGGKKSWPVKLRYEEAKGRVKFQSGWTDFVRDRSLKEGDICEFVLVDSKRHVFEVKITTANHTLSPDIDDGNDEEDEQEDEKMHPPITASSGKVPRANGFESANPDFKILLKPAYIHGNYLYMPAKFAKRYLVKQPGHAILQVERKRTWYVNLHYASGRTTIQSGWATFVQDNDLKEGDTCVFMLTDKIKFLFDVVIFRST